MPYHSTETMYRRLDADNQALQEELETLEEQKKEVEDELAHVREKELREVYSKLRDEQSSRAELQRKVGSMEAKLKEQAKSAPSNQEDLDSMKDRIDELLKDLEHMTAEKEAATKRLEWEKATKRELRQKIFGLQEHADMASTAKRALEEELRALQDQPETQTTESMEELAEKLKHQVQSLQEEKEETLRKMQALEHSVATGEYEVGDSARVREAYVNKLQSDIELLETSVKHLTDENKVLVDSRERLHGEMGKGDKAKFCALDDQIQSLNSQTKELTEKLNATRKEADDAKVAQKEEKDQVLDLQHRMDKNILQLATLRSSTRMNMERIKNEHDEAVKSARESGAAEVREELDEVRREREALKAALEVERQGRKDDEQTRAAESNKDAQIANAKDEEIAALESQITSQKREASERESHVEELVLRIKELEEHAEQVCHTQEFGEEKKDSCGSSDALVRMKTMFEVKIKELTAKNEMFEKQVGELTERNELSEKRLQEYANEMRGPQLLIRETTESMANNGGKKGCASNGAVVMEKMEALKTRNAALESSVREYEDSMEQMRAEMTDLKSDEQVCSERQKFEQHVKLLQSQVEECQKELQQQNAEGSTRTADARDLSTIAVASNESHDSVRTHQLQQGPLAALKASRDNLLARLSRNLHNERDSLARREHALKLSAVAAERAAEAAALTPSKPGSIERNMRDMTHTQEEFESLQSILNHFKGLYEMKDLALKETQIERDELRLELQRYHTRVSE